MEKRRDSILYETLIYRLLTEEELNPALFANFCRRQVVTKCYRRSDDGKTWVIKPDPFIDDWSKEEYDFLIKCLKNTIHTRGLVCAAFYRDSLKGFVSVESEPIGSKQNYLDMTSLHVSEDMRGKGIGRKLFQKAAKWAKNQGAGKLYISSHSAVESQGFYEAMGCVDAEEINEHHAKEEPCDRQLEYIL